MTEGLRCGRGDAEAMWLEGNETRLEDEWEETEKFRIHNVTVRFSCETSTGPWAPANKISHHLSVRETALNRFLRVAHPTQTCCTTLCDLRGKDKHSIGKRSPKLKFPAQRIFLACVCVWSVFMCISMHMRTQTLGSSCLPPLLIDKGWQWLGKRRYLVACVGREHTLHGLDSPCKKWSKTFHLKCQLHKRAN